ncbi:gustatory receptor for sugar taste 64f-like [Bicyclus anynana]|uniref:Gustatory receptor for sugar taste 64f-like n=1 Tax=Bicyclus anynana TaxID=110368 RepID=A0ABM3M8R2_BICAN|nr:gustatory receptor for sugar taste 64f-like [Bicyclus anynana]
MKELEIANLNEYIDQNIKRKCNFAVIVLLGLAFASYWRKLREDYNNASRLVRRFDDVINCITLISFASNLLFVCLQLSYLLANGIRGTCQSRYYYDNLLVSNNSSGSIYPYIYATFSVYSVMFLILRALGLALIAARIHSESLVAVPVLYNVPSPTCGIEVQRFIQQIHGSTVALTGHNFFYVTKDLLLSVVGTIVTYELVLLQFE